MMSEIVKNKQFYIDKLVEEEYLSTNLGKVLLQRFSVKNTTNVFVAFWGREERFKNKLKTETPIRVNTAIKKMWGSKVTYYIPQETIVYQNGKVIK